jgi:hypothetical protein
LKANFSSAGYFFVPAFTFHNWSTGMIFGLFGGHKKRVTELIAAARSGDTEKIAHLLSKGADINAPEPESGDTPRLAAIDMSQWAAAELLLKNHPDISLQDKNGNSPIKPMHVYVCLSDSPTI